MLEPSDDKPKTGAGADLALRVTSGRDEGKVFPLVEGFIGKLASCDIRLSDPTLSAMHARITLRRNDWYITDLTSAPDIRVNNTVIKSRKIQYGDTIVIGGTTLQIVDPPAGLEKPRKIETKRAPAVKKNAPISQTMQISLDQKVEGWAPKKHSPKEPTGAKEKPAHKTTKKRLSSASNTHEPAIELDALEKYRSKPLHEDHEAEKSGFRLMVYVLILVAVVAPLVAGGLYLSSKQRAKRQLSATYAALQEFERNNPSSYEAIIAEYRKMEMLATASDDRVAHMARENINRLQAAAAVHDADIKKALLTLDQRAEAMAEEGRFAEAAMLYENYSGNFKNEVVAARKTELNNLKTLAAQKASRPAEEAVAEPTANIATAEHLTAARQLDAKLKAIVAAAVDAAIEGTADDAIMELKKITADPALKINHGLAEDAIQSMRLLAAVDKAVQTSTVNGVTSSDPAENRDQPATIRIIYCLRKGDLLAAQYLAKKMGASILSDEINARSRMSAADLQNEQTVMGKFASAWSKIAQTATKTIPRPDECIETLQAFQASKSPKETSDFCLAMTRLQEEHPESKFIARYSPFFEACSNASSALTSKSSQLARVGNGKIIDIDANTFFFESSDILSVTETGYVALFAERDIFFDPESHLPSVARIEVLLKLPYKRVSEQQGAFELPLDSKMAKPVKGDGIFVGQDVELGTRIIPLMIKDDSEQIYASDFATGKDNRWKADSARIFMGQSGLTLSDHTTQAGVPDVWVESDLPKTPFKVQIIVVKEDDAPFIVMLDKLQFVLSGSQRRPTGSWYDGHMLKEQKLSLPPNGTPIPMTLSWSPHYASLSIGNDTITSAFDSTRQDSTLKKIGFVMRGKTAIRKVVISKTAGETGSNVLGINEPGTAVVIPRVSSSDWAGLQPGHGIFLLSKVLTKETNSKKKYDQTDAPPQWETTEATITHVDEEFVICAIAQKSKSIGASTIASLNKTARAFTSEDPGIPHYLADSGWYPETIYAQVGTDSKGAALLTPDLHCAFAARGFASKVTDIVEHPYTSEPFIAYPSSPQAADFYEIAGMLHAPSLPIVASNDGKPVKMLLTGRLPVENALLPLSPPAFPILPLTETRSPQGWKILQGDWKDKFGRLIASPLKDTISLAESKSYLWENCQYSIDVKVESASANINTNELVLELYSPFWQKSVALITGTHGTKIGFDTIKASTGTYSVDTSSLTPLNAATPTWDKLLATKRPELKTGTAYNIKIRRIKGDFAFYINGKRVATVSYPGLQGDLFLRVASPGGQISIGPSYGTMLSRSTRIPVTEPDLGEFGYVLAVEGANILIDADTTGLTKNGHFSVMKTERVIAGDISKTVLLKRIAVGTATDMTMRVARGTTSAPSEPIKAGMKIISGLQPETITLTSEQLSSVDLGL